MVPVTPSLTASKPDSVIKKGDPLTLTCSTSSTGSSVKYTFLLNNQPINPTPQAGDTYTVPTDQVSDRSSYSCKVTIDGVTSLASLNHTLKIVGEFNETLIDIF